MTLLQNKALCITVDVTNQCKKYAAQQIKEFTFRGKETHFIHHRGCGRLNNFPHKDAHALISELANALPYMVKREFMNVIETTDVGDHLGLFERVQSNHKSSNCREVRSHLRIREGGMLMEADFWK